MVALIEDPDVSEDPTGGDDEFASKELSPMEYGLQRDLPPLTDRPDVDGDNWKEAVQLGHLPTADRAEILDMLKKHRSMWNGRLRQVHSTAHRIDLLPGQKPMHCQPYRAGPRAQALGSAEIQRMLKAEVIEPATSEWASPIVLVSKRDGSTRFSWIIAGSMPTPSGIHTRSRAWMNASTPSETPRSSKHFIVTLVECGSAALLSLVLSIRVMLEIWSPPEYRHRQERPDRPCPLLRRVPNRRPASSRRPDPTLARPRNPMLGYR
jgi:hypothetical protein